MFLLGVKNADERKAAPLRKDKDGKAVYLSDEFKALVAKPTDKSAEEM